MHLTLAEVNIKVPIDFQLSNVLLFAWQDDSSLNGSVRSESATRASAEVAAPKVVGLVLCISKPVLERMLLGLAGLCQLCLVTALVTFRLHSVRIH